ncbi:hypothetical protein N658DRAFT_508546 [Parathielavia hyrcaniae]|uniref:Conidiation-specific protein 6 n=1 Tax=Parathielavia hyrcaniae TaxID=113614 RepID=A0AAN6PWY9_9PEZI|nr:hypothetical protein N658DRAFT_508546 [Parathielavia hyrcaniae]
MSEPKNRERGLKAAIHNPRVSEEAKQHDRELLASEFGESLEELAAQSEGRTSGSKKSSSTGPHSHSAKDQTQHESSSGVQTSPTAGRMKARRASSGEAGTIQQMGEKKDKGNVIRGLKAALKNPNVSDKAKDADRKKLRDLGEAVE